MRLSGARAICQSLVEEGVSTIFGLPGGAIMPLYDVLPEFPDLHHVLVRHEQCAAHMADGYARAAAALKKPQEQRTVGVCWGTSGPGATNLVTGHLQRPHGLRAAGGHHRQRAQQHDRDRRVPGSRHHWHHDSDHQAELLRPRRQGPAARAARSFPPGAHWPARPSPRRCPEGRPAHRLRLEWLSHLGQSAGLSAHLRAEHAPGQGSNASDRARPTTDHHRRSGRVALGRLGRAAELCRENAHSGDDHPARHFQLPREPRTVSRPARHARLGALQLRGAQRGPGDRYRHAHGRPRLRQVRWLRTPGAHRSRRHRPGRDRQERARRRAHRRRRTARAVEARARSAYRSAAASRGLARSDRRVA